MMDISDLCDVCEEIRGEDCLYCSLGNPCLGCDDYDMNAHVCRSNGACGEMRNVNN